SAGERTKLRRELSMPGGGPVILFVGFFSKEKGPHRLFDAWANLVRTVAPDAVLVFIGSTAGPYYEIDPSLAEDIRTRAASAGLTNRIQFVESTNEIERFYRAADVFVLPSSREGLPNALLEAMASGLACIVTMLPGVTDTVIEDGRNGLLVP